MNLFNVDNDINYLLLTMGKQITINGSTATAIIGYSNNKEIEEKKIITKSPLKRGDLLFINSHNYFIYNEINGLRQDSYYKGYARSCNYNIKFNFSGMIKTFPAITTTQVLDITTNKYMELAEGKIQVILQNNIDTNKIVLQQRFLSMGYAYTINGIDRSKTGLIILNCSVTDFIDNDDKDNEIADRWQYETKHVYTIETTNIDASLAQNTTLQFNVTVKDNGTALTNPTIVYTSNNSNCSVDSVGIVTANLLGTSVITATFTGTDGTVKSISINITVTEPVVTHSYALTINGADTVTEGASENYTITVKDNGTVVTETVTWSLLNDTGTSTCDSNIATLSNATGISCTVNGVSSVNYCTLKAILDVDNAVSILKNITIVGLW